MAKSLNYVYPLDDDASSLKVFQNRTSPIKAFYFTKDQVKAVKELDHSNTCSIYFLFDNSETDEIRAYVGKSVNGIGRMDDHIRKKHFWSYGILFVSDNDSFDGLFIDYLEHIFINKFRKSRYTLTNKDNRVSVPTLHMSDKPVVDAFIKEIEFLLSAEGITTTETVKINHRGYEPVGKFTTLLYEQDGKFVLKKGSKLNRPSSSSQNWKKANHFERYTKMLDGYIKDGKAIEDNNGDITTLVDLVFNTPSTPAGLISGNSENGWTFFKDLNKTRKNNLA